MNQRRWKVAVYAICKNEAQFVDRWMDSMSEADEIVVLDTGSSDDTVAQLRARGATVHQQIFTPWRFDVARQRSLELVSADADICCCIDLDEVFAPGWRAVLEQAWDQGVDQLQYRYTWNFDSDGNELTVFFADKIHARHGFCWKYPVHEVILPESGRCRVGRCEQLRLYHHADDTKSRGQYLPLLELSAAENPLNDRAAFYLGREYFFHADYEKSLVALEHYLHLPTARWRDERAAAMRYLGKCCHQLNRPELQQIWLERATQEAPHLRETWLDAARAAFLRQDWAAVIRYARGCLGIEQRELNYLSESESWGSLPQDLLSIALYYAGQYAEAETAGEQALALATAADADRIRENLSLFRAAAEHSAGDHPTEEDHPAGDA